MTTSSQDELVTALSDELDAIGPENAERLSNILRGLFTCMQDLNRRVAILERQCSSAGRGEN